MPQPSENGLPGDSLTFTTDRSAATSEATARRTVVNYLFVALDCERIHDGASRFSLAGVKAVHLGRGPTRVASHSGDGADLFLDLPDRRTSREHALLRHQDGRWIVEDLGAKNGTWVNGRRVDGRMTLPDGAVLELGHTFVVLRSFKAPPLEDVVGVRLDPKGPGLVTLVPDLARAFRDLAVFARTSGHVSILGETGTGKDVVAHAYHRMTRRVGPFVPVNCGGLAPSLLEAALFGHKRGAYSGAASDNEGLVRAAHGGTLFLDEVGDLPLVAQAALLRVIEAREVLPLGASRPVTVDVRIVCATHRDIPSLVVKGEFRQDLWARLAGHVLRLPPLRERFEDLGLLISSALQRCAPDRASRIRLSPGAGRALMLSRWPLNIRELMNKVAHAVALTENDTITAEYLDRDQSHERAAQASVEEPNELPREAPSVRRLARKAQLEQLLTEHRGNITYVANALGKTRPLIYKWLHQLGIDFEQFRA